MNPKREPLPTNEERRNNINESRRARSSGPALAEQYLVERGLTVESVRRFRVEIESSPDPAKFEERLKQKLPPWVQANLWIPVLSKAGAVDSWIARLLPTQKDNDRPRYLCPDKSKGPPWLIPELYDSKASVPLIITEGAIKAMVVTLAGYDAVGLNGVWCAANKSNGDDPMTLRPELASLHLLGRKVYLAFDADLTTKPEVRQALIRLFFLLCSVGSEVYQLTTWPLETKGIDDYLVSQGPNNGQTMKALIAAAQPFIGTLSATLQDALLVQKELPRIEFGNLVRDQLTKQLSKALDVRVEELRDLATGPAKPPPELSFAENYELWTEPVNAEELLNEIMLRIKKEAVLEHHQLWVCALEVMLTWVHHQMDFSPLLYITGPSKECGKTTLLRVIGKMSRRPLKSSNISPPSIYRLCELYHPTLLMDEIHDALQNPDFSTVLKAGHEPDDRAVRCEPNSLFPQTFDVFCPKVVAGIGRANAQVMSRAILIEMERRNADTDRSMKRSHSDFIQIRSKLARWAMDCGDLSLFRLPKEAEVVLRNRDNWQVYYRVASAVSATVADQLLRFIASFGEGEEDFDTYLLRSLRALFVGRGMTDKDDMLPSQEVVKELNEDEEAPWRKRDGRLTEERLASKLRRYKVTTHKKQKDGERAWRYRYGDLERVFRNGYDPRIPLTRRNLDTWTLFGAKQVW
jgi:putative DNA primase/helicase